MYSFEVYKDAAGEWRWRFSYNNEIMADSGEGYTTKAHAKRAMKYLSIKMFFSAIKVKE